MEINDEVFFPPHTLYNVTPLPVLILACPSMRKRPFKIHGYSI